jgi:hypothetical protein
MPIPTLAPVDNLAACEADAGAVGEEVVLEDAAVIPGFDELGVYSLAAE